MVTVASDASAGHYSDEAWCHHKLDSLFGGVMDQDNINSHDSSFMQDVMSAGMIANYSSRVLALDQHYSTWQSDSASYTSAVPPTKNFVTSGGFLSIMRHSNALWEMPWRKTFADSTAEFIDPATAADAAGFIHGSTTSVLEDIDAGRKVDYGKASRKGGIEAIAASTVGVLLTVGGGILAGIGWLLS